MAIQRISSKLNSRAHHLISLTSFIQNTNDRKDYTQLNKVQMETRAGVYEDQWEVSRLKPCQLLRWLTGLTAKYFNWWHGSNGFSRQNCDLCIRDPISIRTREVFRNCQFYLPNKNCIFFFNWNIEKESQQQKYQRHLIRKRGQNTTSEALICIVVSWC